MIFLVLLRCGMEEGLTREEGGLGVSGFGEELGRLVCRRGGREGGREKGARVWVGVDVVLSRLGSARYFIRRDSDEASEGVGSGVWA